MMPESHDQLSQLLEQYGRDAAARRQTLGPIVEAASLLRDCCSSIRATLDQLDVCVALHLDLLNIMMVQLDGDQWWKRFDALARDEHGEL